MSCLSIFLGYHKQSIQTEGPGFLPKIWPLTHLYSIGARRELGAYLLHFHFMSRKMKVPEVYSSKHLFTTNTMSRVSLNVYIPAVFILLEKDDSNWIPSFLAKAD